MLTALNLILKRVAPSRSTSAAGVTGHNVQVGGYVQYNESSPELYSHFQRYVTFSNILANTPIVAAGVRYLLNLVAGAKWTFLPAEADSISARRAKVAEEALTSDPVTSWHRIVRYLAMYRMYGFALMEWTAARRSDGLLTFRDISPRPQSTIERWNMRTDGAQGVWQRDPINNDELFIPRAKMIYVVDDALDTGPEGMGIFRQLVRPARRARSYENIEKDGFQTDLRGIPIGRAPFAELMQAVADNRMTEEERQLIEAPLRKFLKSGIRGTKNYLGSGVDIERDEAGGNLSIAIDSATYRSDDDAQRPTREKRWDIELLTGDGTSYSDIGNAITRIEGQLARTMGIEQLLLGSGSVGSHALSKDKTEALWLVVESIQTELTDAVKRDLVEVLWQLNGWDSPLPEVKTETVRYVDIETVGRVLRDLEIAGLDPDDPAFGEVRDKLGLTRPDTLAIGRIRSRMDNGAVE